MSKISKYSDNQLVEMMKGRKVDADSAFTEIYNRYSRRIYTFCVCMLHDKDEASDVFQDAFIRFYKTISKDFRCVNLSAYLYSIARNLCLNSLKKKNLIITDNNFSELVYDDISYENKELFNLVLTSIDLLEEKYREPLILRELEGLPYNEIAEICGLTVINAKTRVIRAKEKVIHILEPYLNDFCK